MDLAVAFRARQTSHALLAGLGRRWKHVQGVAFRASELAVGLPSAQRHALVAAAWLHDVGYAPALVMTGFHSLDGAAYCARAGFPDLVVRLVAHHTGAAVEADERGLLVHLSEYPLPPADLLDRLTTADLTTSPDGRPVLARDRVAEILDRYEPYHPVHRAVSRSGRELIEHAELTEARIGVRGVVRHQPLR